MTERTKDTKRILNNVAGFSLGGILTKAVGFLLIPIYTRFLTPADYGILEIANVIVAILSILFLAGQIGSLQRFFYDYKDNSKKLKEYVGTIVVFVIALSLFLTVLIRIAGKPLLSFIEGVPFHPYMPLVLWISFFSVLFPFPLRLLQVRQKAYAYSVLEVSKFIVTVGAIIFFVAYQKQGALGSLRGQLIAAVLSFGVAAFLLRKDVVFSLSSEKLGESLRFGLPLVPHMLAGWILTFADRAMINHYIDLSQVGIYSLGYKFGMVMSLVVTSANLAWAPFFMSTMKERADEGKKTITQLATYFVMGIIFIALAISLFSKEMIQLMATKDFFEAYKIVPIIVVSYVFQGLYFLVVNQVFYIKKTKGLPFITLGAAILNIILNIWWIPVYGIYGAAWATAVSYFVIFISTWIFAEKVFSLIYEYKRIAVAFGIGAAVFALSLLIKVDGMLLNIGLKALYLLMFPLGLMLTGLVKPSSFKSIMEFFKRQ